MIFALIALILSSVADVVSTLVALRIPGLKENNPVAAGLIGRFGRTWGLILSKLILVVVGVGCAAALAVIRARWGAAAAELFELVLVFWAWVIAAGTAFIVAKNVWHIWRKTR